MLYQDCERFDTKKVGNFLGKLSNCHCLTSDTYCMEFVSYGIIFFFYKTVWGHKLYWEDSNENIL